MSKMSFLLGLLVISGVVVAKTPDEVKYSLGASGAYVESDRVRARVLSLDVELKLSEKIDKNLSLSGWILGNFENGSNSSAGLKAEFQPNQALNLMEGGILYTPFKNSSILAGVIWQNRHSSPLLVWGSSFAGLIEEFKFGEFRLKLQQSIPNNNILSRRLGGVSEGTPFFLLETIGIEQKKSNYNFVFDLSYFQFENLYSQVALVSQDFGNSVEGIGQSAKFSYGFQGVNAATSFIWNLKNEYLAGLNGQFLYNQLAPTKRNMGYLAEMVFGKKEGLLKLGMFRNESDSSPAFYNSRFFGHNNIQGSVVTMTREQNNVMFRFQIVNGKIIESNARQADASIVNFQIVRNYEI